MTITFKFTTTTDFSEVSPDVFATFTSAQVSALSKNQLASLNADQLNFLSVNSLAGLKVNLLDADHVTMLIPEQISALTPAQIAAIGSIQAAGLIPDQIYNFTPEQAASFPSKALTLLNADQIPALNMDFISSLPAKTFAAITIKQIPALNMDQAAALTPEQVASFSAAQATALSPDAISALDPKVIGSLAIDAFDFDDIWALTADQAPFLTSNQLSHLSAQQVAGFNAGQIESMKPATFKGLSTAVIFALTTEAVSGITTAQLSALSTTQLASFTSEQLGQFNQDAIDWLTSHSSVIIQTVEEYPVAIQHSPTGKIQISGNAIQDETLSIQNTLKDEDGLGAFKYQWLRNSKAISGATQSTYTLSESDIGTAISVKVSYTDGLKKLESVTSSATALIEPKPEEILLPTYALTVDKTSVNEGDTVTFKLMTENVAADTEIPFKFGGTISSADVLGGLKTTSFTIDSNGKASLAVKFLADKFTDGITENLTLTLNSGESQSVSVKDTSVTPAPVVIVKPVVIVPVVEEPIAVMPIVEKPVVVVKPAIENTSTGAVKVDGVTKTAPSNANKLLIGGAKNDLLTGLAGADTLRGDAGQDFLDGGLGNDLLEGGNGNDTIIGGDGNDTLLGGSDNDTLDAGIGNDSLDGGNGNDTLMGGEGADTMIGGTGNDYYFVDNQKDSVKESDKNPKTGGVDTIERSINIDKKILLEDNVENLILTGLEDLNGVGNTANNKITGNSANNFLDGKAGNDTLIGSDGDDTLDGGLGTDQLDGGKGSDVYFMNNDGDVIIHNGDLEDQDEVIASVDYDLNQSPNIEILTLRGAKAINGTGNDSDNLLREEENGTVANNFNGGKGDDNIMGAGGNDTLSGGDGNDTLDGGIGEDTVIFDGAFDDYDFKRNVDGEFVDQITVEYINAADAERYREIDILDNIELIEFSDGDVKNVRVDALDVSVSTSSSMLILTGIEAA